MQITQTRLFKRTIKKLHKQEKRELDEAVKYVLAHPAAGEMKKADLAGIRVYKFRIRKQLTLLAYQIAEDEQSLTLLALGSHENFYRDLKQ